VTSSQRGSGTTTPEIGTGSAGVIGDDSPFFPPPGQNVALAAAPLPEEADEE